MYLHSIQLAIPKTRFSFISFGFNSVAIISEAADNNINNRPSETERETKGREPYRLGGTQLTMSPSKEFNYVKIFNPGKSCLHK